MSKMIRLLTIVGATYTMKEEDVTITYDTRGVTIAERGGKATVFFPYTAIYTLESYVEGTKQTSGWGEVLFFSSQGGKC